MVFALLVAIQHFNATVIQKSLIAGALHIGLIMSMPYASWSAIIPRKTVRGAIPVFVATVGLTIAALARNASIYTVGIFVYGSCSALAIPIMTGIYRDNYRGHVRGQVYGVTALVTVGMGLAAQFAGGGLLEADISLYRLLFLALALLNAVAGVAVLRMPIGTTSFFCA